MRHWFVGVLLIAGALLLAPGCGLRHENHLGAAVDAAHLATVRGMEKAVMPVTLRGTMVEKCPVAACWFRLKDDTGVVKVDVKAANFTVTDVPLGATVTVTGKPVTKDGEPYLAGTGLTY
jgi:uncharacterized protein YdeI (BOF family)